MKISKHVFALTFAAGLAGAAGLPSQDGKPVLAMTEVGWYLAKQAEKTFDLDEDAADATQAVSQAVGATIGAASGAVIGAKIGLVAGVVGAVVGAGLGAF